MKVKVVIYDADKTLWDHYNISEFREPIKVINRDEIEDAEGRKLRVFPDVRSTLEELKSRNLIIAMATWNFPEKAERILEILDLRRYFDVVVARDFPYKFVMINEILSELRKRGIYAKPEDVIFVDDRRAHFGNVWLYVGRVKCVEMWRDISSHSEILKLIE
ncbi:MAG: magnesium-dependent phosphatase-1 [Candidatus Aramenus sulfurataquae]|jgi:magnesium-dependent phosphatase-1|uniref:Phosphatase n=2 Tax=Candidatus Aramenus sulfurataquae TaxID=1326980 RepID=W7KXH6_9CREN|nr:MAG: magnesium-dependent phosphatase-1 [Candidatus Aramenus sulfurataquae]MBW9141218.1 magnesium-dependent phosphatase-1 [Candidatus Aramenus sp.]MCL7343136.1 magnesium-dependent phosphatase-1 [Candidatus Aramenus sulfurataquae]